MWIFIAPHREHTLRRSGMAHVLKGSVLPAHPAFIC